MYLRVTAFKSDPARLDEGIAFLKDKIVPSLSQVPGFVGATAVVNREKSTGAASTLWESLEAMNKAEQAGMQARIDSEAETGIEVLDVDRFEITRLEVPSGPRQLPSYTRIITGYGDPARLETATEMLREQVSLLKAQPGFRAFAAGANRATGRAFTTSSFDTAENREASNAVMEPFRKKILEAGSLYGVQIDLVETVVAEIKVPATA